MTTKPHHVSAAIAANKRFAAAARRFGDEEHAARIDANTTKMEANQRKTK